MDLGKIELGPEAAVAMKLENGMVKVSVAYVGADANVGLHVDLKPQAFVAKLKEMIPGKVDDMVFDLLLAQLK